MRTFVCAVALLSAFAVFAVACSGGRDNSGYRVPRTVGPTAGVPTPGPTITIPMPDVTGPEVTTASGLRYIEISEGTGATPLPGQNIMVHYTGWLASNREKFDSSFDRGTPIIFPLGHGQVIRGWDEGLSTMKIGGKRRLIIPPDLGYGASGSGPIPGDSTLIFDVELVGTA